MSQERGVVGCTDRRGRIVVHNHGWWLDGGLPCTSLSRLKENQDQSLIDCDAVVVIVRHGLSTCGKSTLLRRSNEVGAAADMSFLPRVAFAAAFCKAKRTQSGSPLSTDSQPRCSDQTRLSLHVCASLIGTMWVDGCRNGFVGEEEAASALVGPTRGGNLETLPATNSSLLVLITVCIRSFNAIGRSVRLGSVRFGVRSGAEMC